MKAIVQDGCISCGLCTDEYPDLFQMNDDGLAEAIGDTVPAGKEEDAQKAAEECPVGVIKVSS